MDEDPRSRNPYSAPEAVSPDSDYVSLAPTQPKSVHGWWLLMVALNIPLPLYLGVGCTSENGRAGMGFGIVLIAVVGLFACSRFPRVMEQLCLGSILTALSQFYPIFHMFLGIAAVQVTQLLFTSRASGKALEGVYQVAFATVLTGIGLIVPALIAGSLLDLIFHPFASSARPPWRKKAN